MSIIGVNNFYQMTICILKGCAALVIMYAIISCLLMA